MPTQRIDFASLSPKDALDLAILIEEEAYERYLELADQMEAHRTPEAAAFFRFMSLNEDKHRSELLVRRSQLFLGSPRTVDRSMLFDVEAPEYHEARAFMSAKEAMQVALRAEQKARQFFEAALPGITDAAVRKLFSELYEEEVDHEKLVLAELSKLPDRVAPDPDDYGDEPIAL